MLVALATISVAILRPEPKGSACHREIYLDIVLHNKNDIEMPFKMPNLSQGKQSILILMFMNSLAFEMAKSTFIFIPLILVT